MASRPQSATRNHGDGAAMAAPVERGYDIDGGQAAPHDHHTIVGLDGVERVVGQAILDEARIAAKSVERRRNAGFWMRRRDDEQVGPERRRPATRPRSMLGPSARRK